MTERQQHHAVYVISVFAELAGVHPQTLRNYERGGLLNPVRTSGGSRRSPTRTWPPFDGSRSSPPKAST